MTWDWPEYRTGPVVAYCLQEGQLYCISLVVSISSGLDRVEEVHMVTSVCLVWSIVNGLTTHE